MEQLEKVGKELVELNNQYKDMKNKLDDKKEEIKKIFLSEGIDFKKIEDSTIYQIPEKEQIRLVKQEIILNTLSDKIEDSEIIEDILSIIMKNSKVKSYIKIV